MRKEKAEEEFILTTERIGRGTHVTIYRRGKVQPFGAIFYLKRGDDVRVARALVRALNEALKRGDRTVWFKGTSGQTLIYDLFEGARDNPLQLVGRNEKCM
jgi:hypothetical protein